MISDDPMADVAQQEPRRDGETPVESDPRRAEEEHDEREHGQRSAERRRVEDTARRPVDRRRRRSGPGVS